MVSRGEPEAQLICQGDTVKLMCANSFQAIAVYTALYGREKEAGPCPFRQQLVSNDTNDKSLCPMKNVTLEIMGICHKKKHCRMTLNQTLLGTQCQGIYQYLTVIFKCGEYLV